MFTYRSFAVLTLSLMLAQGIAPSVSASPFRGKEKSVSSGIMKTVPEKPEYESAVSIMEEGTISIPSLPDHGPSLPFINTVDDGDNSFRARGRWTVVPFAGWQSDFRFAPPKKAYMRKTAKAVWSFKNLQPGEYDVFVTWDAFSGLATDAPFNIIKNREIISHTVVNQSKPPIGEVFLGRTWQRISQINIGDVSSNRGNGIQVQLTNEANSYVAADGVALKLRESFPQNADLSFSIKAPHTAEPGEKLQYMLSASNNGPSNAQDVMINLTYNPIFLEPIFDQPEEGGNCKIDKLSTIVCQLGDMPAGVATGTPLMFRVKETAPCEETIYTEGYIKADKPVDLQPDNNFGYAKTFIECEESEEADLSLQVIHDYDTTLGGKLKYTIDLSNAGPDTSDNTRVILSNYSKLLRFDAEVSDGRCEEIVIESFLHYPEEDLNDKEVGLSSNTIICNFGDMEPNTGITASLMFDVDREAECGSTIRNLFESDSDTNDPDSSNNNVDTKVILECYEFLEL